MGLQLLAPTSSHATVQAKGRIRGRHPCARIIVPVRYSAWLNGDLGRALERAMENALSGLEGLRISRLPRAFLVEAHEAPGPFLESVLRATEQLEQEVEATHPVFHHQIGPVWTGTLQSVFG